MTVGWNSWRKHWKFKLMLKCKHSCTCSSEIGTCIINDTGETSYTQKKTSCIPVLKVNINFQRKKKLSTNYQTQQHIPLTVFGCLIKFRYPSLTPLFWNIAATYITFLPQVLKTIDWLGVYWSLIIWFFKCGRNVNKPGQQWFNIINTTDKTIF